MFRSKQSVTKLRLAVMVWLSMLVATSFAQHNFNTDAVLSKPSADWPWFSQADFVVNGITYRLSGISNGSWENSADGGVSNSKCLTHRSAGGNSLRLARLDGEPFKFSGMFLKHSGINSYAQHTSLPPWYTITYHLAGSGGTETEDDNTAINTQGEGGEQYTVSTKTYNKNLDVVAVSIFFKAQNQIWIDDIRVGAVASAFNITPSNGIVYVKKGGSGNHNGSNWANATGELARALKSAKTNATIREIWVARGTYSPAYSPGDNDFGLPADRNNAFLLVNNVKIYGGFAGTETALSQRDLSVASNASILTGGDNAYHVVVASGNVGTAELNGFTITGGKADGQNEHRLYVDGRAIARDGGGGISITDSSPKLANLIVSNNYAKSEGGGIWVEEGAPSLFNTKISGNRALHAGGGISNHDGILSLNNVLISGNAADYYGAGINTFGSTPSILKNVTVSGNATLHGAGAGIRSTGTAHPVLYNSIVWANGSNPNVSGGVHSTSRNNYIQGLAAHNGNAELSANSFFVSPVQATSGTPVAGGDFSLRESSVAVNAGNNSYVEGNTDLAGNSRILGSVVDLGAYEYKFTHLYVDSSRALSGTGVSWSSAYKTLAEAMNVSNNSPEIREIHIARGTYYPTGTQNSTDRDSAFTILRGGLKLYGGYSSGGGKRDFDANPTILSGDIGTPGSNSDNSYHVMVVAGLTAAADSVVIDGLQIVWGNAGSGATKRYNGHAIDKNKAGGLAAWQNNNGTKFVIRNCRFSANRAADAGGAVGNHASSPLIINCLFSGNHADYGGAMINGSGSHATIINCTFAGNRDNHSGGAMRNSSSNPVITNTVIYGNQGGISNNSASPVISYSLVQGSSSTSNHNINGSTNPLFVDAVAAAGAPTVGGDYRLNFESPCVDKGSNTAYTAARGSLNSLDLYGDKRLRAGIIDMGAYELFYAKPNANGVLRVKKGSAGTGETWASALPELADALKAAKTNTEIKEIWVAGGTYKPLYSPADVDFGKDAGRNNAFLLVNNVKIYGGFAGTESALSQRNLSLSANKSILSGDLDGNNALNNQDAFHVVISAGNVGTAELNGFSIVGGYAYPNSSATLTVNSRTVLQERGAGIFNESSSPVLSNIIFSGNSGYVGAAVANYSSSPTLVSVAITQNTADYAGGIYNTSSSPTLVNVTISGNTASNPGAGIRNISASNPKVYNSIIWGNSSNGNVNNISISSSTPEYSHSIVQGSGSGWGNFGVDGGNNWDTDPMFAAGGYAPQQLSAAVNAGSNTLHSGLSSAIRDLSGNLRVYAYASNGIIDIGAYEYQGTPVFNTRYVKPGGTGNGGSWATASADLQLMINLAATGNQVWVAGGTYKPNRKANATGVVTPNDRDNAFVLKENVKIYGGFAGNETSLTQRDLKLTANKSILSGDVGTLNNPADNTYHVVVSAGNVGTAELNGFTITGGYMTDADGSSIVVNGSNVIRERGSALSLTSSSPRLQSVIFENNRAYAGVVSHTNSNAIYVNTLFAGNTATYGTVYNASSSPVLVNCTISGNTGADNAGNGVAMRNTMISNPKTYNTIIRGNHTANGNVNTIFNSGGANSSTPGYYHSLVQGITDTSNGNLNGDIDPMFSNADNGDYRPEGGSLVINAGDNTYFEGLGAGSRDLDGNPRLLRHHIDLGAYESDCSGSTLASDAEVTRPLTTGNNYLYSSCSLLAVVSPENSASQIVVSTVSAGDLVNHHNARYVGRYYQLSAENTGNTEVTLFFTRADFDHYNSTFGEVHNASLPGNLRVARYSGDYSLSGTTLFSEAKPTFIHNHTVQWNETLQLWEVTFTTPGFSGFFITGQSDEALPVALIDFTVVPYEQSALLEWRTAKEINTSRYEIQRSTDGRLWQMAGEVAAAGESDAPLVYRHRDLWPLSGLSYYRLKMIDQDGTFSYSNTRSVVMDKSMNTGLELYPNPASSRIFFKAQAAVAEVLLWDLSGLLVRKVHYDEISGVSLVGLNSGILLVEVRLADGTSRKARVVVHR